MEKVVNNNQIQLYTQSFGNSSNPAILLTAGAGAPSRFWSDNFCKQLADKNYFVIRYDQRDTGLSSAVDYACNPYTITDLAADAIAILNTYNIKKAHIVGHSMGGYIAQVVAIEYPDRVLSLTLISSGPITQTPLALTSLFKGKQGALLKTIQIYLTNLPTQNFEESKDRWLKIWKQFNGLAPLDTDMALTFTRDLYERSHHPIGIPYNHIKALKGINKYTGDIKKIDQPTLIIHGEEDSLLPKHHGKTLAEVIDHAQLEMIPDMGHVIFNKQLERQLVLLIYAHVGKTQKD